MNANNMIQSMVAIAVAVAVFGMILLPIVQSAAEQGVTATGMNETSAGLGFDATTITIEYDSVGTEWTIDEAHADVTQILTSEAYITFSASAVDLNGSPIDGSAVDKIVIDGGKIVETLTGSADPVETITLEKIKGSNYVLTDAAESKTYGMWTTVTGVLINADANVIVIGASDVTMEKYTAESTLVTATVQGDEDDYTGAYEVSAIDGTTLVASLSFTYTEPLDGNMAAILEVIPILVILGIMMACVYMFISNRGY